MNLRIALEQFSLALISSTIPSLSAAVRAQSRLRLFRALLASASASPTISTPLKNALVAAVVCYGCAVAPADTGTAPPSDGNHGVRAMPEHSGSNVRASLALFHESAIFLERENREHVPFVELHNALSISRDPQPSPWRDPQPSPWVPSDESTEDTDSEGTKKPDD